VRYYSIIIKNSDASIYRPPSLASLKLPASWTSFVNNQTIPGALDIQIEAYLAAFNAPVAGTFVRVWGISIEEIGQASDLRGKNIQVFAGMQKGLPLANPAQSGLILQGYIFKSFGNWVGTDQTLDLIVVAGDSPFGTGSKASPKNIIHLWAKGTPLSEAIKSTLTTAFPGYEVDISINPKLVLTEQDTGYYESATQYAQYIQALSKSIINDQAYLGVSIVLKEKKFTVYDGTTKTTATTIDFKDLIGQPTWIGPQEIQVKTVMRADIAVGAYVKLPVTQTTTTSEGALPAGNAPRANSIFQGEFFVKSMSHFGRFRQPDAASWNTILDLVAPPGAAGTGDDLGRGA